MSRLKSPVNLPEYVQAAVVSIMPMREFAANVMVLSEYLVVGSADGTDIDATFREAEARDGKVVRECDSVPPIRSMLELRISHHRRC